MRFIKTDAIVLKRQNKNETDRFLTVFTREYGKMTLLAKGVRKIYSRRAPHLEIFGHAKLVVYLGKNADTISEAVSVDRFETLRSDLYSISVAYYLCELVNSLTAPKQEHQEVFDLLLRALRALEVDKRTIVVRSFPGLLVEKLGFISKDRRSEVTDEFIEGIIEKHLKTPKFMNQVAT